MAAKTRRRKSASASRAAAFRCLDPRLTRLALDPAGARELPPGGVPAKKPRRERPETIVVPTSLSGLPLARLGLLAQVSAVSAQRLRRNDRVSVLIEAEPTRSKGLERLLQRYGFERTKNISRDFYIARVPRGELAALASHPSVRFVEASVRLKTHCELAHASAGLVSRSGRRLVKQTGKGVLVGVIDSGIDAAHRAFWSGGKPRIVHYRDQMRGDLYSQADIARGRAKRSPDEIGHGTHVAGIAAGNGWGTPRRRGTGVAPQADLAIVKTSLSTADIADAVAELFELASRRRQACVVNLSMGVHAGGHDGSSLLERAIDTLCEERGRVVVVSAGNEGSTRIHAGTTLARGQKPPARWTADFELKPHVVESTLMGLATIEVWTQNEDDLSVVLRSPNGEVFQPPRGARAEVGREQFAIGMSHQVARYSRDHVTSFSVHTVAQDPWLSGWSLLVSERPGGRGIEVGRVHAWISDESMGFFTNGFARTHLIGLPGTAAAAITVASYASRSAWKSRDPGSATASHPALKLEEISYFSSAGPTRTGHNKPDIAAPGHWIQSTLSSDASTDTIPERNRLKAMPYAAMQGTSMAAPYVTGAIALLLERNPTLHWSEVLRRLVASTNQDRFSRPCWNERWGHGKLSVERFLAVEP